MLTHREALAVLRDPERFSSAWGTGVGPLGPGGLRSLNLSDPPLHTELRRQVARAFRGVAPGPGALGASAGGVAPDPGGGASAAGGVSPGAGGVGPDAGGVGPGPGGGVSPGAGGVGPGEGLSAGGAASGAGGLELPPLRDGEQVEWCRRVSAALLLRALGLAAEHGPELLERSHDVAFAPSNAAYRPAEERLWTFLETVLAQTWLPLLGWSRDDSLWLLRLLILAGQASHAAALAGSILALAQRFEGPVSAEPGAAGGANRTAVEELLRFTSPVSRFSRVVRHDTILAGHALKAGQRVAVLFPAANRDPAAFHDPHQLNLNRDPNPHLAFGGGPHHCLGAALARASLGWLVAQGRRPLLQAPPSYHRSAFTLAPSSLRVRWA